MQWLMVHMWTALAGAGVLGLLFGWAVRGLRLNSRLRKAEGERNIAIGTLMEKEGELEALYAAGRSSDGAATIATGETELRAHLQAREAELQTLTDELARAKADLVELQAQPIGTKDGDLVTPAMVGAAVAGVASQLSPDEESAQQVAENDEESASLQWRNRYLESQVRTLQEKIQDLSAVQSEQPDLPETSAPSKADVETSKLKWQNDYLRQRIDFFEKYGAAAPAPESKDVVAGPAKEDQPVRVASPIAESTSDQELARLRWRNRYLEGRLAYYEGDKGEEEDSGIAELAAKTAIVGEDTPVLSEGQSESASDVDEVSDLSGAADILAEAPVSDLELEDVPSDDVSEVAESPITEPGEKPIALEEPTDGEGDDLTAIGGIGPKIQEVLNSLGIFHYDQIASWTPENVEWIDDHLSFEGRISREQWVQQAAALSDPA